MPDPKIEDRSDAMEEDLHQLEDHIADAEKKVEARRKDADGAEAVTGDWEGEQDRGGGDDPQGAARDAAQGAPGGSQDGPGADGPDDTRSEGEEHSEGEERSEGEEHAGGEKRSEAERDDEGSDDDEDTAARDERDDDEYAGPT